MIGKFKRLFEEIQNEVLENGFKAESNNATLNNNQGKEGEQPTVKCSNCGASIENIQDVKCEYCGSLIKGYNQNQNGYNIIQNNMNPNYISEEFNSLMKTQQNFSKFFLIIFSLIWTIISLFGFIQTVQLSFVLALVPLLFGILGISLFVFAIINIIKKRRQNKK